MFISHNYLIIKIDSYVLTLKETLTLHNVVILIQSLLNKNKNHYYYNVFLERCLYQLAKKYWQQIQFTSFFLNKCSHKL